MNTKRNHLGKKGPLFVPGQYQAALALLSKAALTDIAWNLALLNAGREDAPLEAFAILASEADVVCRHRDDAIPIEIRAVADRERERLHNPRASETQETR